MTCSARRPAPALSVDAALAEGQPVSSGQPLVTVTDASTLSLTAQVDETDVLLVKAGVPATAELDAVPDASYTAAVTTIDPTPTTSTPRRGHLPGAAVARARDGAAADWPRRRRGRA